MPIGGKEPIPKSELLIVGEGSDSRVYHTNLHTGEIPRHVLVVGDPARTDQIAAMFDNGAEKRIQNREYVTVFGRYNGMPVAVLSTGIGTDNNEIAMVELACVHELDLARRVRQADNIPPLTIIRVGTSGGIQIHNKLGTLAIGAYGLGFDNSGLFYDFPPASPAVLQIENAARAAIDAAIPDNARFKGCIVPYASRATPRVVNALKKAAEEHEAPYDIGITAAASGFFGNQGREIPGMPLTIRNRRLPEILADLDLSGVNVKNLEVINMEMESSLLFHLGGGIGYNISTICPIIAHRQQMEVALDYHTSIDLAARVALEALHELYLKDLANGVTLAKNFI